MNNKIKEFFEQRKKTIGINRGKQNLSNVYYAYSIDGETCAPFTLSHDYASIQDLSSNKSVNIISNDGIPNINLTLSKLYNNDDYIHYANIIDMICRYTNGNEIVGEFFKKISKVELSNTPDSLREFKLKNISTRNVYVSKEDLEPLTKQLKQEITAKNIAYEQRNIEHLL